MPYKIDYSAYEIEKNIREVRTYINTKSLKINRVNGELLQFKVKHNQIEIYIYERVYWIEKRIRIAIDSNR